MAHVHVSPQEAAAGADPHCEGAGKTHDWRNHVPEGVRAIWGTFTPEQRAALVAWADKLASDEEWD